MSEFETMLIYYFLFIFKNENYDEALEYFQKEVSADAKNGYAYSWMALIYQSKEEYGMALTSVNNALKYIPKKDASFLAATYIIRADTYLGIKDTLMAINDYGNAIRINPSSAVMFTAFSLVCTTFVM